VTPLAPDAHQFQLPLYPIIPFIIRCCTYEEWEEMTNGGHTPEVEDEIAKFWAGYQAREEERWRKERGDNKLQISLIAASDDAPTFSPEGQAELRRFSEQVRDDSIKVQSFGRAVQRSQLKLHLSNASSPARAAAYRS
jgi:hypothetical protein